MVPAYPQLDRWGPASSESDYEIDRWAGAEGFAPLFEPAGAGWVAFEVRLCGDPAAHGICIDGTGTDASQANWRVT